MEAALDVVKNIKSLGIDLTIKTWSVLLYSFAQKGDIENIRKIISECREKNVWVSDKVLLKIIYHLTLNNHKEYIDEVINRLHFLVCK